MQRGSLIELSYRTDLMAHKVIDFNQEVQKVDSGQSTDAGWQNVAVRSGRSQDKFSDPVAQEPLIEFNRGLPQLLAFDARASLSYINAQGALVNAGVAPPALDASARMRALNRETRAVESMKHTIAGLTPGQLNAVLAAANSKIKDIGVKFAVNQFGAVSLVDGDDAIWHLGKGQG